MKNDLLIDKMKGIQQLYKQFLYTIKDEYSNGDSLREIADEVMTFWFQYRNIVDMYLKILPKDNSSYLFTGAGYLDVESKEQYPFKILGKKHIIDDSLVRYLQNIYAQTDTLFLEELKVQTQEAIQDNIEILENYSEEFTLIPVRFFMPEHQELLHDISSQLFLSLFDAPIENIEDFLCTYPSIEQLFDGLNSKIKPNLVFSEQDAIGGEIEDKFKNYITLNQPICENKDNVTIFFLAIYGYIAQATDVLLSFLNYNITPYIRYEICYHYILLLAPTFLSKFTEKDSDLFANKLKKMTVAHVFYRCFDFSKIEHISFEKYVFIINELEIDRLLNDEIESNLSVPSSERKYINRIVEEILEILYESIEDDLIQ